MNDRLIEFTPPFSNLKCVVCNGFGTVTRERVRCHGCHGKGYIIIDNKTGLPVEEVKND